MWGQDTGPSSIPEDEEGQQGQSGSSDGGRSSLESMRLHNVTRQDDEGENYKVVPQPIVAPHMVHPGYVLCFVCCAALRYAVVCVLCTVDPLISPTLD